MSPPNPAAGCSQSTGPAGFGFEPRPTKFQENRRLVEGSVRQPWGVRTCFANPVLGGLFREDTRNINIYSVGGESKGLNPYPPDLQFGSKSARAGIHPEPRPFPDPSQENKAGLSGRPNVSLGGKLCPLGPNVGVGDQAHQWNSAPSLMLSSQNGLVH